MDSMAYLNNLLSVEIISQHVVARGNFIKKIMLRILKKGHKFLSNSSKSLLFIISLNSHRPSNQNALCGVV